MYFEFMLPEVLFCMIGGCW